MSGSEGGVLAGRAALVTGGGSGIGLACATSLVRDGASVTIAGRTEERLRRAADELTSVAAQGARVAWAVCDVTSETDVRSAVSAAESLTGGLHLVVAGAGMGALGPIVTTPLSDWQQVMDVNVTGTFLTFKHAGAAVVRSGGGAMVAISSLAGLTTHRFMAPYCASKAAIDMLVRVAADELGPAGVRVCSVLPSLVDTELVSMIMADEAVVGDYLSQMPVSRVGQAADVAAAVRYLLGPESGWVTGVNLPVDGGHHLRRGPDYEPAVRALFGDAAADSTASPD